MTCLGDALSPLANDDRDQRDKRIVAGRLRVEAGCRDAYPQQCGEEYPKPERVDSVLTARCCRDDLQLYNQANRQERVADDQHPAWASVPEDEQVRDRCRDLDAYEQPYHISRPIVVDGPVDCKVNRNSLRKLAVTRSRC